MRSEPIFHLALAEDWERDAPGDYVTSTIGHSLAEVGFIHCSFHHQVAATAARFYGGRDGVVLLEIDPSRVPSEIVVEDTFPHIYGPLPRAAVVSVTPYDPAD